MPKTSRKTNTTSQKRAAEKGNSRKAPRYSNASRPMAERKEIRPAITPIDVPVNDPGSLEEETLDQSAPFNKTYGRQRVATPASTRQPRGSGRRPK
jgi:hypothetical protein